METISISMLRHIVLEYVAEEELEIDYHNPLGLSYLR